MARQNPVDDDDWEDVDPNEESWEDVTPTPNTPQFGPTVTAPTEQPGMLSRAWHAISDPLTDLPSRAASSVADMIDSPSLNRSPMMARVQGFGAGALQGLGDVISGLSSPINLGTAALTGGGSLAAKSGMTGLADAATMGARTAGGLTALHGGQQVISPESSLSDRMMGVAEMAGGVAGMKQPLPEKSPTVKPPSVGPNVKPPSTTSTGLPIGVHDEYAGWRKVPVGQTYKVTPAELPKPKISEAIRLGFEVTGIDDNGKIVLKKIKESPQYQESKTIPQDPNVLVQALNFPRAVMASMDFSAPLRQGLPLIHKKEFWKALPEMFKAWGSEESFNALQSTIKEKPLFQNRVSPEGDILPSIAEDAGLKLSDITNLNQREESFMSKFADKIPGITRSNRAYTAFLNKLRADTFETLMNSSKALSEKGGVDGPVAQGLANFVNYSTGRGSLGRLESSAAALNAGMFAPRLMASRLKILNPWTYVNPSTPAVVRKEALKSIFTLATAGNAVLQLGKMAGGEVESDPASSDYGKVKFGNGIRIDPWAGAQQYIVLANRMISRPEAIQRDDENIESPFPAVNMASGMVNSPGGKFKSSQSGSEYMLGEKYGGSSKLDVAFRFGEGKANPVINFVTGMLRGKDLAGKPFDVPEEVVKRFTPIMLQDLKDLIAENPNMIPFYHEEGMFPTGLHPENAPAAIPPMFGMGMQRYGEGE